MYARRATLARHRAWFRHLGRMLAVVVGLVVLVGPVAEAHDGQGLQAHVEAPRTAPHPGQRPDVCPACVLLTMHGCVPKREQFVPLVERSSAVPATTAEHASQPACATSNSSRAPPIR
jgi:hypothetical protein